MIELSEFDRAFYKKLKADSDQLDSVQSKIKYLRSKIVFLDGQPEYHTLAKDLFEEKYQAEVELQKLEREKNVLLQRVKSHVN